MLNGSPRRITQQRTIYAAVLLLGIGFLCTSISILHDERSWALVVRSSGPWARLNLDFGNRRAVLDLNNAIVGDKNNSMLWALRNPVVRGLPTKPSPCPTRYLWYLDWTGARTNNQILALINALHVSSSYGYTLILSPAAEALLVDAIDGDGLEQYFCIVAGSRDVHGRANRTLWSVGQLANGSQLKLVGKQGRWTGEDMFRLMPRPGFREQAIPLLLLYAQDRVWQVVGALHRQLTEGGCSFVGVHVRSMEGSCSSRLSFGAMGDRYRGQTANCRNVRAFVMGEVERMRGPRLQSLGGSEEDAAQTPPPAGSNASWPQAGIVEHGGCGLGPKHASGDGGREVGSLRVFVAHDAGVVFQAMREGRPLGVDLVELMRAVNGSLSDEYGYHGYHGQYEGYVEMPVGLEDHAEMPFGLEDHVEMPVVLEDHVEMPVGLEDDVEMPVGLDGRPTSGDGNEAVEAGSVPLDKMRRRRRWRRRGRRRRLTRWEGESAQQEQVYYQQGGELSSVPVSELCATISDEALEQYCDRGYEPFDLHYCPPQEPHEGIAFRIATFCSVFDYVQHGAVTSMEVSVASGLNSEQASLVDMLLLALSTYFVGNPSSTFTSNTVLLRQFLGKPRTSSNVDLEEMGCYGTREPPYQWALEQQEDGQRMWTCKEGVVSSGNLEWYLDELPWRTWNASSRSMIPTT